MNKEVKNIEKFKSIIENSNNIVFFGGAGVSTESGIPDFRSKDGLYNQKYKYMPEQILSHTFFKYKVQDFYAFYKDKLNCINVEPNITHKKLAKLEEIGKLKAIITQNIDGLHFKAGSKNVCELHGSIYRNYCQNCNKFYEAKDVFLTTQTIPLCACGGIIKPDVVLYEEMLDDNIVNKAIYYIANADTLIVAGTSLSVFPASSLIKYFKGSNFVYINEDEKVTCSASLTINDKLGNVFSKI
ncbi:MAG: NAD-dependent protein deacylase [Clostridia bacterium]